MHAALNPTDLILLGTTTLVIVRVVTRAAAAEMGIALNLILSLTDPPAPLG